VEERLGERPLVTEEMMLSQVLSVVSEAMSPRRESRYETPPRYSSRRNVRSEGESSWRRTLYETTNSFVRRALRCAAATLLTLERGPNGRRAR
jgi:hypothetical protein